MSDLRISAQQALEALKMMRDEYEEYACPACDHADAAIYALRAALVEDAMQKFSEVNQEIQAALAEPVQEPVAGRAFLERILTAMEGVIDVADRKTDEFDALRSCVIDLTLMLHTVPPQRKPRHVSYVCPQCHWSLDERKPLSGEQLRQIELGLRIYYDNGKYDLSLHDFARAIERAHGIGDDT